MESGDRFSTRYGFEPAYPEITIRTDAPPELREAVVCIAYELGLGPKSLRPLVCQTLRKAENSNNWTEYPNVDDEVRSHLNSCEWYKVYNIIEAIHRHLSRPGLKPRAPKFEEEINRTLREGGIGWQLEEGKILIRGPESFESQISEAEVLLEESGRTAAARELQEARRDLSRQPEPDITGAIQHAGAALECAARDISGDAKATLGSLTKKSPGLFPRPLDKVIEGVWGFASEKGRHVKEGVVPDMAEAELLVAIAASVISYIVRQHPARS